VAGETFVEVDDGFDGDAGVGSGAPGLDLFDHDLPERPPTRGHQGGDAVAASPDGGVVDAEVEDDFPDPPGGLAGVEFLGAGVQQPGTRARAGLAVRGARVGVVGVPSIGGGEEVFAAGEVAEGLGTSDT